MNKSDNNSVQKLAKDTKGVIEPYQIQQGKSISKSPRHRCVQSISPLYSNWNIPVFGIFITALQYVDVEL